jgi:hypothetical protein
MVDDHDASMRKENEEVEAERSRPNGRNLT